MKKGHVRKLIAELLTRQIDIDKARSMYQGRIFPKKTIDTFIKHKGKPYRFYRIKPTLFVLVDAVNFPENSRQEYKLKHS